MKLGMINALIIFSFQLQELLESLPYFLGTCNSEYRVFMGFIWTRWNGRWFRPLPGYVKLNVDCSVRGGNATYGGPLRDEEGRWVWGFTGSCGFKFVLYAELMAMKASLMALHQKKCVRVIVETNSSEVVQLVNGFPKRLYRRLLSCSIACVPRVYNYSADCIAKLDH